MAALEHVERDEDRRRTEDPGVVIAEQMEPAHELLVVHRHLAVQGNDVGLELRDGGSELAEAARVVHRVSADQADVRAVLVGEDPPTVDFLLVDPAVTGKGGRTGAVAIGTDGTGMSNTEEESCQRVRPSLFRFV